MTWGFHTVVARKYITGARMSMSELMDKHGDRIKREVKRISRTLNRPIEPDYLSLLSFSIQQKYYTNSENRDSRDYLYWKENGWLDTSKRYFFDVKRNPVREASISIIGSIIKKIILT